MLQSMKLFIITLLSLLTAYGYLIVYRENTPSDKEQLRTWLPEGKRISIKPILGDGRKSTIIVGTDGLIKLKIRRPNSFVIYEYTIKQ